MTLVQHHLHHHYHRLGRHEQKSVLSLLVVLSGIGQVLAVDVLT